MSPRDKHSQRRSLSKAQKIAELQRHRETKFDLDDREMHSLAREIRRIAGLEEPMSKIILLEIDDNAANVVFRPTTEC